MQQKKHIKHLFLALVWSLSFTLPMANPSFAQDVHKEKITELPAAETKTKPKEIELSVPTSTKKPADTDALARITVGLLVVLGLLFGGVWVLKRSGFSPANRRNGFYKLIAINSIGQREKIALVEIGDTWLVLGMTAHSINTLHSMPKDSLNLGKGNNAAASFAKMLERLKNPQANPVSSKTQDKNK